MQCAVCSVQCTMCRIVIGPGVTLGHRSHCSLQQEQMSHLALTVPGFTAINGLFVAASVQLLSDGSQIPEKRPFLVHVVLWEAGCKRKKAGGGKKESGRTLVSCRPGTARGTNQSRWAKFGLVFWVILPPDPTIASPSNIQN